MRQPTPVLRALIRAVPEHRLRELMLELLLNGAAPSPLLAAAAPGRRGRPPGPGKRPRGRPRKMMKAAGRRRSPAQRDHDVLMKRQRRAERAGAAGEGTVVDATLNPEQQRHEALCDRSGRRGASWQRVRRPRRRSRPPPRPTAAMVMVIPPRSTRSHPRPRRPPRLPPLQLFGSMRPSSNRGDPGNPSPTSSASIRPNAWTATASPGCHPASRPVRSSSSSTLTA